MKYKKRERIDTVSNNYSTVIANRIVSQLDNNRSLNQIVKEAMSQAINAGARAIKVKCIGNTGSETKTSNITFCEGRVNLWNNSSKTIYGFAASKELSISVKVWILPNTTIQVSGKKALARKSTGAVRGARHWHKGKRLRMAKPMPQPTPPPTIPPIKVPGYKSISDDKDIP